MFLSLCCCNCFFIVWLFFCRCIIVPLTVKTMWLTLHHLLYQRGTQHSFDDSDSERLKNPLDSQTFSSIFKNAPTVVERIVRFDTLGSTFISKIFADKDWANLFGNFEDLVDELVKKFYSNARFTGVELKCWVQGKDFIITPDYLTKTLRINRLANVDISPYDDRLPSDKYSSNSRS